jgi:hypothetical protein
MGTSSVTKLRAGTQYTQVAFQYAHTIPGLAISPPADNGIWKRFEV